VSKQKNKSLKLGVHDLYVHRVPDDTGKGGYLFFHDSDGNYLGDADGKELKKLLKLIEEILK